MKLLPAIDRILIQQLVTKKSRTTRQEKRRERLLHWVGAGSLAHAQK